MNGECGGPKGLIENYKELEGCSITVNEAQSRDISGGGGGRRHGDSGGGHYRSGGCSGVYGTTIVVDMEEASWIKHNEKIFYFLFLCSLI
ncbi:unnamed protein product [Thlaspi arvense]|uniref:Glycine-rich protein n=1 Tax=Thlaspi arvense TaxID=13288 RepID=A0AAU9RS49_THLAR|nr:unnamed protein product [Thlaspi arvense]